MSPSRIPGNQAGMLQVLCPAGETVGKVLVTCELHVSKKVLRRITPNPVHLEILTSIAKQQHLEMWGCQGWDWWCHHETTDLHTPSKTFFNQVSMLDKLVSPGVIGSLVVQLPPSGDGISEASLVPCSRCAPSSPINLHGCSSVWCLERVFSPAPLRSDW